jgi:hypothetical protein
MDGWTTQLWLLKADVGDMPISAARRSRLLAIACVVAGAAAVPSTASAGVLVDSAASCDAQTLSQPFLPWADVANYTPAPNGTIEAGASSWALDAARVVSDNEPYNVAQDNGTRSLRIDAGGSAVTQPMCVGLGHPTVRFFSKRAMGGLGGLLSTLRVDVLYENNLGLVETLAVGLVVNTGTGWTLTAPFLMVANLLPLLPGETTPVSFRFTPQGPSAWQVDDVFVDPWRSL